MTVEEIYESAAAKMKHYVDGFRRILMTIRTGRASLSLLDGVRVDYYGSPTPLNQVATLTIPDPTLIVAQPWDPSTLPLIEKAILKADLDLNPTNDGKVIRIPIPPLTEERRKAMAKKVHILAEEARTAVRQIRRDANEKIKHLQKDKAISLDEEHRALDHVQKLTDQHIKMVDDLAESKEQEILAI
ncbi:MAG: ribosome recycling factor [Acidobacteriota bacterium]